LKSRKKLFSREKRTHGFAEFIQILVVTAVDVATRVPIILLSLVHVAERIGLGLSLLNSGQPDQGLLQIFLLAEKEHESKNSKMSWFLTQKNGDVRFLETVFKEFYFSSKDIIDKRR
jgi:hypothetical protein